MNWLEFYVKTAPVLRSHFNQVYLEPRITLIYVLCEALFRTHLRLRI
jgi:hypothetical protein